MFVPERVETVEAKIVYGRVDEFGHQNLNIDIPGVGVLICEHVVDLAEVFDFGFDWHEETAYQMLFGGRPEQATLFDQESSTTIEQSEPA
jgi:hypothetical protein